MGGFGTAPVRLLCVALAVGSCLWASTGTAAAKGSKPVISNFKAAPASVPSEGTVIVSATVSGATQCTLSSNKPVSGLPAILPCEGVNTGVLMPANTGKKAAKYKLQLTAEASTGGKAKAKATVSVSPAVPRTGTAVAAGFIHTCTLLSTGHVECWGENGSGELGDGTTTSSGKPVEVWDVTDATQVTAGGAFTCALLSTGHVECWGSNGYGGLGDGTETSSDTPVEVQGIADATQVTSGGYHTCAVLSTGHVECWGYNGIGELGNGTTTSSDTPVEVQGIADATQVTAGRYHTCAALSTGHVECWGSNGYGGLGDGTETPSDTPVEVSGVTDATQVTAAEYHTCAVLSTGHVECWGLNAEGELGDGTNTGPEICDEASHPCSATPVEVSGVTDATQVTAGGAFTCAVLSTGHVECWGVNEYGELGDATMTGPETCEYDGFSFPCSTTPVEVSDITDATQVTASYEDTCALLSTGRVDCWGWNAYGQLGNGTETSSDTPVEVSGV
jgi:alpha-tubulin suppressor-like RCC1 family protein